MALRFRRGLDIERQAVVFVEGEPTYTTDNKEFFIGDGVTPGGIQIGGLNNLIDDATPRLGGNLDLNSNNIIGSGDIEIIGNLKITGSIDVGKIEADYTGSLFSDDSTLIVDAINHRVYADVLAMDGDLMLDATTKEVNLEHTSLSSLMDVEYTNPSPGALLTYDGNVFSLNSLGTVDGIDPIDKQLLQYEAGTGWIASDTITKSDSSVLIDVSTGVVYLENTPLDSHGNVINLNLQIDDVLAYDGVNWVNKQLTIENADISLVTLDDVIVNNPGVGDKLEYNGTFWTNTSESTMSLQDLDNVTETDIKIGDILVYDGINWNNAVFSLDQLADVLIAENINIGDVLQYDGANWVAGVGSQQLGLDDLDGMYVVDAVAGDTLRYDGVSWTNVPIEDEIQYIDQLDDVILNIPALTAGQVLGYDGSVWTNIDLESGSGGGSTSTPSLHDIIDVAITNPITDQVLTFDGSIWINMDLPSTEIPSTIAELRTLLPTKIEELDGVAITNPIIGDALVFNGTDWESSPPSQFTKDGDFTGTFQGNILGNDSTILVDADTRNFHGNLIGETINSASISVDDLSYVRLNGNEITSVDITTTGLITTNLSVYTDLNCHNLYVNSNAVVQRSGEHATFSVKTIDNTTPFAASTLELSSHKTTGTFGDGEIIGKIYFSLDDDTTAADQTIAKTIMVGTPTSLVICNDDNNTFDEVESFCLTLGKVGVGTYSPTAKLDVVGDVKVSGFTQFGSLSTTERDALTAADGMVIYNNTTSKFQGYAGGAWVDLH